MNKLQAHRARVAAKRRSRSLLWRLLALAALVAPGAVSAQCEAVTVKVTPFEVTHDYTVPFDDLSAMNGGKITFGAVRATVTAKVQGCTVEVGYSNVTLFVASELRRNTCAFQHVLRHELEHVRIYEAAVARMEERITVRALESADDLFVSTNAVLDEVRAEHRAHDSPEEYRTNATACSGRILKLTGLR